MLSKVNILMSLVSPEFINVIEFETISTSNRKSSYPSRIIFSVMVTGNLN